MLKNTSLAVKLNISVLLVLALLLLGVVFLLIQNTQNLTEEIGGERIIEEANFIQSRLAEIEREMLVDTNFIVRGVSFYVAVGRRSSSETSAIINTANTSLGLDDISVVDGDGRILVDTEIDADSSQETALLMRSLENETLTSLVVERNASNSVQISLAAAAPILSNTGNILGAMQMSRHISSDFLQALLFGQDAIYLGLIYEDQIIARSNPDTWAISNTTLVNSIALNPADIALAKTGELVINDGLVIGTGGVPHTVAYVPVLLDGSSTEAVIMIVVELQQIFSFQNSTLWNTVFVFIALTVVAIASIYLTIYRTMVRPLEKMRNIAHVMANGRYDERLPIKTNDEVGQLAAAFNEMAIAVQLREVHLEAAREGAERADRVKSMFLASVSHELRTPLNAIINLTKFVGLGMYGAVNQEQVSILEKVESRSKHLLNLINDVLDISKIEAGSLELFVEEDVNLAEVALTAIDTAQSLITGKAIEISYRIEDNLPKLTADSQRIQQIILNLLSNACRFSEKGQIEVAVYQVGQELWVSIKDSGPGIAKENFDLIFEAFRQTKDGLRKGEGTGLGLPISRRLAEAHQGRVWLESELGKGATFYLALPLDSGLVATL